MYTKEVLCSKSECEHAAEYKVAAPWSTGRFSELKSYGLACADHFGDVFGAAQQRSHGHHLSEEETVGEIGLYAFAPGKHDRELERLKSVEEGLRV